MKRHLELTCSATHLVQNYYKLSYYMLLFYKQLVYDDRLEQSLRGSVNSNLQRTMAHVQTKYCHQSLGTKIKLNV